MTEQAEMAKWGENEKDEEKDEEDEKAISPLPSPLAAVLATCPGCRASCRSSLLVMPRVESAEFDIALLLLPLVLLLLSLPL
eukprot:9011593-Pyramimonas_sp.AAC.1